MRGLRWCPLLAAVIALAGAAVAQARPSRADIAATHAYLLGRYHLEATLEKDLPAGLRLAREYGKAFAQECQGVLAGAPTLHVEEPSSDSLALGPKPALEFFVEALGTAAELLAKPAIPAFASRVERLSWSDRELTMRIHARAHRQAHEASEPVPDLCADAKFWSASGFREVSPATHSYWLDHEGTDNEPPEGEGILKASVTQLLRRFEGPADRRLALRLKALEKQTDKKLAQGLDATTPNSG